MVRVMASGVFDILHLGHIHYLNEARKLGDELYVVVANDDTVRKLKHEPINLQDVRLRLVEALKPVDSALLGRTGDRCEVVKEINPDIIALGYDQERDEEGLKRELAKHGLNPEIHRLPKVDYDLDGTRKLIRKVIDWYAVKTKLDMIEGR